MKAPKWLKCPAGVTFGFDGKLVSFGAKKGASGSEVCILRLLICVLLKTNLKFSSALDMFMLRHIFHTCVCCTYLFYQWRYCVSGLSLLLLLYLHDFI